MSAPATAATPTSALTALSHLPKPLTALVIGGTSGIGLGIAKTLVQTPGCEVTIAGRSVRDGEAIARDSNTNEKGDQGRMSYKKIDASLMRNVRVFCGEYVAGLRSEAGTRKQVDLLVLSQGMLSLSRTKTSEGLQVIIALNFYSRILFVRELIRLDALSPAAIVVFVLNGRAGDPSGKTIQWNDLDLNGNTSIFKAIPHNFALMDVMLQQLAKSDRASGTARTYVHDYPGFVRTELINKAQVPWILKKLFAVTGWLRGESKYLSIEQAGEYIVSGAIACGETTARSVDGTAGTSSKTWYYMDEYGKEIDKVETSDDVRLKVDEHTMRALDEALEGQVKKH